MIAECSKVSALRKSTQSQTAPKKIVKTTFDGYDFFVTKINSILTCTMTDDPRLSVLVACQFMVNRFIVYP